jgi:hypothetical protein
MAPRMFRVLWTALLGYERLSSIELDIVVLALQTWIVEVLKSNLG